MKKITLESQVENVLKRIKSGCYDAKSLCNILGNVEREGHLTDVQSESLNEAIETQLWKVYPRDAKKRLGPRNTETREKLERYFIDLKARFDLSANHHKNKVKLGGNVISGQALIYDYISYRDNNTRMIVSLAFRKFDEEMPVEIAVEIYPVGKHGSKSWSSLTFASEDFEAATKQFEIFLTSVLASETT